MKYKIGDVVSVISCLNSNEVYDGVGVHSLMLKYRKKKTTIFDIVGGNYRLTIDKGYWIWSESMLTHYVSSLPRSITIKGEKYA